MLGLPWLGRGWVVWISAILPALATLPALAEVPKNAPPEKDTLQAVLDRIHSHAAGDAWQQPGWKDDAIEAYLDKLIATLAVATENKDLKLPVRLAEVKPPDANNRRVPWHEGELLIGNDLQLNGSVRRSVILAAGSVEFDNPPESCVIIARHSIVAKHVVQKCVLVAGGDFFGQFAGLGGDPTTGDIIVARGCARMSGSYGSTIVAGDGIRLDHCQQTTFLNAAVQGLDRGGTSRSILAPSLKLSPPDPHPLCGKIEVLGAVIAPPVPPGIMQNGVPAPRTLREVNATGLVFRMGERRQVATLGEPIVDDAGQPIEALRGWQLSFITENVATFRNGESQAVVRIERK